MHCGEVRRPHFFPPEWQILTQALTAFVMIWFAVKLLLHFPIGSG